MKMIKRADKVAYGVGNLSYGIMLQMVSAYIVFYGSVILGLQGKLIGMIVGIGTIWDAVTDPVMGYISDHTRLRYFGRRHLYILIGAVGMAIFGMLIFTIDSSLTETIKAILLVTNLLLLKTFSTIYATPYMALGAELCQDYEERTSIQSYKTIFFVISLIFPTIISMLVFFRPTPAYPKGQLNPNAYASMGMTGAAITLAAGLICYLATVKYIPYLPKAGKKGKKGMQAMSIYYSFFELLKNKDYRAVALGYMFTNIASALVASIGLHMFTYTYNLNNVSMSILFGAMFITAAASQPLWIIIAKNREKKGAVILGAYAMMLGSVLFMIALPFKAIIAAQPVLLIPIMAVMGFGLGGMLLLPYSMVSDTIDLGELNTGKRNEGIYLGCMTFAYKASQAIAIFIFGMMLDLIDFKSSLPRQSEFTNVSLGLLLPVGCFIAIFLAYLTYKKYSLTEKDIQEIQIKIKNKEKPIEEDLPC